MTVDSRQPETAPCAGGVGGKGGRWHTMAWVGRLSTFSTKNNMFTHVCDVTLSSDAPATTSLPERLDLTFTSAAPELHMLPCFSLTAAVPAADKAVANNLLELGTFLKKQGRHKVAQMKLPGGRSFNLCAVRQGPRGALWLECRVQEAGSCGGETWHAGVSANDAVRRDSASRERYACGAAGAAGAAGAGSAATAGSSQGSAIDAMRVGMAVDGSDAGGHLWLISSRSLVINLCKY